MTFPPLSIFTRRFLPALTGLALATGCRVAEPVPTPAASPMPASFTQAATPDSAGVAALTWRQFFGDKNLVCLIDTALQANPDLRIAVQRIEIARANLRVQRGALLPSVDAVASAGVDRYGAYTLNGVGNYDTNLSPNIDSRQRIPTPTPDFFLGLRSSWEIDLWGKLSQRKQAAYLRLLATEKGRHLVETALVAQVASLYFDLLALDNELAVLGKNQRLQESGLKIVKVQKQAGRANELAVQQFRAQLLRTRSLEAEARQRIVAAENELNRLLGRYPQRIARGLPILQQPLPARVQAGLPATMLLKRPDVQQAELELVAARADVAAARAAFLPSLTLTPYVGLNAYKASLLFNAPSSLAIGALAGLAGPIINRNALKANYSRSAAEQQVAYFEYQKAMQTGFEEVVTNLRGIGNYQRMYELQQQEVEALNQAVSISDDLFKANYATYLEVITAQRSVLEAELNLSNTRRQQFLRLIDLYRSLGGGWTPTTTVKK
ncbi:efflux transporter, outer membrane factor (OMF) lipoprotein, NodT family [Hymenobacter gelipurpurascens]|uniref:Efflux transporter, outer membrane factor (OMF) lipoprotein, NodT family n=1 Tax=Hymenobacter gelipurpurascens TaxID=89968 RepID=A0A212TFL1_9BACT|nr:TolC family protein [Hymenobacter gelipurpurascens]SNC64858.1 efflux transporter, outer membrane factor (OMF) lipoprotein, NodT family [Hymenobacter gelipurpurascens]